MRSICKKLLSFYILAVSNPQVKFKKRVPFTVTSERIKCLGINVTKGAGDLYTKKYKTLLREIKTDINKCGNSSCLWIKRLSIVKMAFLPKSVYIFNTIPIKIPADLFADIDSLNLKFVWKYKGLQIAKAILKKKSKIERYMFPVFKSSSKATVVKTVCC